MRTKSLQLTGRTLALGAFAAAMAIAGTASADTCPAFAKTVVIVGSSAVSSFMTPLGNALANHVDENSDPDPINVLYQSPGSCTGATFVVSPASPGTTTGDVTYYTGSASATCTLAGATKVDIGISDVFAASCGFDSLPSKVKEFRGPVQSMAFAVSSASQTRTMSAEAAYLALGVGDTTSGFPFPDLNKIWVRDQASGTQQMIAHAINVPANAFISAHSTNAAGIITGLQASSSLDPADTDATFGILGMDAIRGNTANDVVPLAYQHYGQECGFWPSTTQATAPFDMQNTRDGHYFIQGPIHMFTKVNNAGDPSNENAKILIDYLTGAADPDFDLIALEAAKSIVPDCAMHVMRDEEAGPFMSYQPPRSCDCKWLDAVGATPLPEECTTCDTDDDCDTAGRPKCNYGFCEVQ